MGRGEGERALGSLVENFRERMGEKLCLLSFYLHCAAHSHVSGHVYIYMCMVGHRVVCRVRLQWFGRGCDRFFFNLNFSDRFSILNFHDIVYRCEKKNSFQRRVKRNFYTCKKLIFQKTSASRKLRRKNAFFPAPSGEPFTSSSIRGLSPVQTD